MTHFPRAYVDRIDWRSLCAPEGVVNPISMSRQFSWVALFGPQCYLKGYTCNADLGETLSSALELLRKLLRDCVRPLSWKVTMFEELQKLAAQSQPGGLKDKVWLMYPENYHEHVMRLL